MDEWRSVQKDGLPKGGKSWVRVIVNIMRSHYPTSSYDIVDSPYSEEFVIPAMYDSEQKIWHLDCEEQLNALIDIEDSPLNGDFVTHWMPLPCSPSKEEARSMYDFVNFLVAEYKKQGSDTLVIKECPKMRFPDPPEEVKRKLSKLGEVYVSHFTEATEEGDLDLHEYNIYFGNSFTEESLDGLVRVLDENCGYVTEQPAEQLTRKLYDNGFRLITRK